MKIGEDWVELPPEETLGDDLIEDWDIPIETTPEVSESLRNEQAMVLTAAGSRISGTEEDTVAAFDQNYEALGVIPFEDLAQTLTVDFLEPEMEVVADMLPIDPEGAVAYEDERKELLSDPTAAHRMAIEGLSQADSLVTEVEIANSYAGYMISEMMAATSVGEDIANLSSEFFLPVNIKDRGDFIENVFPGLEYGWDEAVAHFISLDPEQRIKLYPALQEFALDATDGNEARAARFLSELYRLEESTEGWDIFGDVAIVGPALLSGLYRAGRAYSFLHTLKRVNKQETAEIIVASTQSAKVANATGVTPRAAAESASPFNFSTISPDAVDGVEAAIVKTIEESTTATRQALKAAEDTIISRSPLTPAEKKIAQQKSLEKFNASAVKAEEQAGWSASNAHITKSDDLGFTIEFDATDANGRPMTTKPLRIDYNRDHVGFYAEDDVTGLGQALFSPSTWANRKQENVVELATAIGFSQEKLLGQLMGIANHAMKGLTGKETARVDRVLIKGDEWADAAGLRVGKTFTPHELMREGIPGVGRLTSKETVAYYQMRTFYDELHRMARLQVAREWNFNKVRELGRFGGQSVYGNVVGPSVVPKSVRKVVNMDTKTFDDLSTLTKQLDEKKLELVKLQRNVRNGDEIYEYGVIRRGAHRRISELDPDVLPKKTGYVPLIRTKSYYFVEAQVPKIINGQKGHIPTVVRSFDKKSEAEKFAKAEQMRTGEIHTARYDREVDPYTRSDLQASQFGKPIFGSRALDRDILYGMNGDTPERLSAIEGLERNINAMAHMMPMNQFRIAQMEKWHKSARPYLNDPRNPNSGFRVGEANTHAQSLSAMRKWLDDMNRIPTKGDQRFQGWTRAMAEMIEDSFLGNVKLPFSEFTTAQKLHEIKDPFGKLRGLAFHTLLGWFNPAQLLVQGMGSTIAISLDPVKFPKIIHQYASMRALVDASDDSVRAVAKAFKHDPDEFAELHRAFQKSGVWDSLKTNADYNAAGLGYSFDSAAVRTAYGVDGSLMRQGVSGAVTGVKMGADKGLMFFREGERFHRGYAWLLAAEHYKKTNKIKKLTDADIDAITTQSLKYTMNMNRANRADWQKGLLSIPTQFWQVTAKFMETMLPRMMGGSNRALTAKQKSAIMVGQVGFFGAVGVPLGTSLANYVMDFLGIDSISEDERILIEQGAVGAAFKAMLGDEIDVSERFAFGSGFNMLMETFTSPDKEFGEILVGASGAFPSRVIQVAGSLAPRLANPQFSVGEAQSIASRLATITSTWNNASKAIMMYKLGEIRTGKGQVIEGFDPETNMGMIYGQALGFAPSAISEYYDHRAYTKGITNLRSSALKSLEIAYRDFLATDVTDPENQRQYALTQWALLEAFDPVERAKVEREWHRRQNQEGALRSARDLTARQFFESTVSNPSILSPRPLESRQER